MAQLNPSLFFFISHPTSKSTSSLCLYGSLNCQAPAKLAEFFFSFSNQLNHQPPHCLRKVFLKGEHWCGTIIGGVNNCGKMKGFALQFFQNFALFKRYQPLKFKILNFFSSLVVVWTYFGRSLVVVWS